MFDERNTADGYSGWHNSMVDVHIDLESSYTFRTEGQSVVYFVIDVSSEGLHGK